MADRVVDLDQLVVVETLPLIDQVIHHFHLLFARISNNQLNDGVSKWQLSTTVTAFSAVCRVNKG